MEKNPRKFGNIIRIKMPRYAATNVVEQAYEFVLLRR